MIKYEDLMDLYLKEEQNLRSYVLYYLLIRFDDYNDIADCINEILYHGCASGCVSTLIYYTDTVAFYHRFREEINKLVYDACTEIGSFDLSLLFEKWDLEDPLCIETFNINLLAWFGFEETLYRLAIELEVLR